MRGNPHAILKLKFLSYAECKALKINFKKYHWAIYRSNLYNFLYTIPKFIRLKVVIIIYIIYSIVLRNILFKFITKMASINELK